MGLKDIFKKKTGQNSRETESLDYWEGPEEYYKNYERCYEKYARGEEDPEYWAWEEERLDSSLRKTAEQNGMKVTENLNEYIHKYCNFKWDPEDKYTYLMDRIKNDYIRMRYIGIKGIEPEAFGGGEGGMTKGLCRVLDKMDKESDIQGMIQQDIMETMKSYDLEPSEELLRETENYIYKHDEEYYSGYSQAGKEYLYKYKYRDVPLYEQPEYKGKLSGEDIVKDIESHGLEPSEKLVNAVARFNDVSRWEAGIDDIKAIYQMQVDGTESFQYKGHELSGEYIMAADICYDCGLVHKDTEKDIARELQANGFQPTKSLVSNIARLNELGKINHSMESIRNLWDSGYCEVWDDEMGSTLKSIVEECRTQEMENLQLPQIEM